MYFPYLRGRQFEVLALKELIENGLLGKSIIPVIEPVKASTTLLNALTIFSEKKAPIAFVVNPKVGAFNAEFDKYEKKEALFNIIKNPNTLKAIIFDDTIQKRLANLTVFDTTLEKSILINLNAKYLDSYSTAIGTTVPVFNFILDETSFRRKIHQNKVLSRDSFAKEERNSDYSENEEVFSEDHLYYKGDGYLGFSDYSIVGNEFKEAGFAPHAVVIHIVYLDSSNRLMIRHFVSDSNADPRDPANKFGEALKKLVNWNKTQKINTLAMRTFEDMYKQGSYPGLGTIKKLSIMQHLETVKNYFEK